MVKKPNCWLKLNQVLANNKTKEIAVIISGVAKEKLVIPKIVFFKAFLVLKSANALITAIGTDTKTVITPIMIEFISGVAKSVSPNLK